MLDDHGVSSDGIAVYEVAYQVSNIKGKALQDFSIQVSLHQTTSFGPFVMVLLKEFFAELFNIETDSLDVCVTRTLGS